MRLNDWLKESSDSSKPLGYTIYDILHKELDYKNPSKNETIIRQYFK